MRPGKLHVIDFWASLCAPCVAKLPKLKELAREVGDELVVTWFSTDASAGAAKAREIADRFGLPAERLVIGGKGSDDPVWQMFGSGPTVRIAVPTYALIDAAGTLRCLGSGGAELEELRAAIAHARGR